MLLQLPILRLPIQQGVLFDQASASGYEAALSTYSWTHPVGIGITNRVLVVGVSIFATGTVSSVTYNGVSLTFLRSDVNGIYRSELWYLLAPATGSNTVVVTLSASLTSIANAQSYGNVNQSTPIDANAGGNGTNTPASASVTTIKSSVRVVGNLASQTASGITVQGGQAPRTNNTGALGTGGSADKGIVDTPASTTLQWNGLGVTDSWAISLAGLKPLGAAFTSDLTETVTLADTIAKLISKPFSEGITASDALAKLTGKVLAETVTLTDSIIRLTSKPLAEGLTVADTMTKLTGKPFSEGLTLADVLTKLTSKAFSETITLADTLIKQLIFVKTLTETITLTDSLSRLPQKVLNEGVTLGDTLIKAITQHALAEVLTLTDTLSRLTQKTLSETVTLSDVLATQVIFTKTLTEVLTLSDTLTRQAQKVLLQSLTVADVVTKQTQLTRAEALTLIQSVTKATTKAALLETLTLTDTLTTSIIIITTYIRALDKAFTSADGTGEQETNAGGSGAGFNP